LLSPLTAFDAKLKSSDIPSVPQVLLGAPISRLAGFRSIRFHNKKFVVLSEAKNHRLWLE
jgi:hypothetical protein